MIKFREFSFKPLDFCVGDTLSIYLNKNLVGEVKCTGSNCKVNKCTIEETEEAFIVKLVKVKE